VVDPVA